jgi:hypothetical protein
MNQCTPAGDGPRHGAGQVRMLCDHIGACHQHFKGVSKVLIPC